MKTEYDVDAALLYPYTGDRNAAFFDNEINLPHDGKEKCRFSVEV